jgi:hypothetical protein
MNLVNFIWIAPFLAITLFTIFYIVFTSKS